MVNELKAAVETVETKEVSFTKPFELFIKGRVVEMKSTENDKGAWYSIKLLSYEKDEPNTKGALGWFTCEKRVYDRVRDKDLTIFKGVLRRYQAANESWNYSVRLMEIVDNERLITFGDNFK